MRIKTTFLALFQISAATHDSVTSPANVSNLPLLKCYQLQQLSNISIITPTHDAINAPTHDSISTPAHDAINAAAHDSVTTAANDPIFCTLGHVGKSFPTFSHSFISNAQSCQ